MNRRTSSIRARLGRMLLLWSLIWTAAVSAAVWTAVRIEIDEKLDNRLRAASVVLVDLMRRAPLSIWQAGPASHGPEQGEELEIPFAWQLVDDAGAVLQRAGNAPARAFHAGTTPGLSVSGDWRVFGTVLRPGQMLYVAHEQTERLEAQFDVAANAALAALALALLGHLWLRWRLWQELQPLQTLSERLRRYEPGNSKMDLGPAERSELESLHRAVDGLAGRLAERIRREQGFSAHAAHALRTPLAGVDAQLSIALREAPEQLQPRLARIRSAAQRMQHVVTALLGLFRAAGEPRREAIDLQELLAHMPAVPLPVRTLQRADLQADVDLLTATLINLFDNADRHGASELLLSVPAPQVLRVENDGQAITPDRLRMLQQALAERDYGQLPGLGLVLADVVARAHGGTVSLQAGEAGFVVELTLGPAGTPSPGSPGDASPAANAGG